MAQPVVPLDPLLLRLVAPLSPTERATLQEASKAPGFTEHLQAALQQASLDRWTGEGQVILVAEVQQRAPAGDQLDLPGYLAALTSEQLDDVRASVLEEQRYQRAHVDAGGTLETYDPSLASR